jgi:hypothetical protein
MALALRALLLFGLLVTAAEVALAAIWPSLFTIAGIVILPAPFLFAWGIVRPTFIKAKRLVRLYLIVASVLALGSLLWEAIWLST